MVFRNSGAKILDRNLLKEDENCKNGDGDKLREVLKITCLRSHSLALYSSSCWAGLEKMGPLNLGKRNGSILATVQFSKQQHPFYSTLKSRVDSYFAEHQLPTWGNWSLYLKTIILLVSAVALYIALVVVQPPVWISVLLCSLFGVNLAAIGFNVMHDGAHGSFSGKEWVNNVMAYSLNLMGGSSFLWKIKHNMIHHSFTNVEGIDDDIDIQPWIRTSKFQPRHWYHRFQNIYWIVLYGLTYFIWVFYKDFSKYFQQKVAGTPIRGISWQQHVIFWLSKTGYFVLFLLIPMYYVGVMPTIWGYLIISTVCGIVLAVVFQLAHVVDETEFHDPQLTDHTLDHDWAIHQVKTTSNFATRSKWVHWITGGLNFQVEHHLFPRVSHIHYPALSLLVKETCEQFGITYNEHKTVLAAVRSHVSYLRDVGRS